MQVIDGQHRLVAHQKEQPEFLALVGRAILQWQEVESAMAIMFGVVVSEGGNPSAGIAAHLAINSTAQKLATLGAAIETGLGDTGLEKAWGKLAERVSKASSDRNALAHGMWLVGRYSPDHEARSVNTVQPNPRKRLRKPATVYDIEKITAAFQEFSLLEGACAMYLRDLQKHFGSTITD